MRSIALFVVVFAAMPCYGQFTVVNKMPALTVVNKMPVEDTKSVFAPKTKLYAFRAPTTHVHICANGHPFDHQQSSSHHCPLCGAEAVKDRNGRYPVAPNQPVVFVPPRAANKQVASDATLRPAPSRSAASTQAASLFAIPRASASNCASGQCATYSFR